MHFNTHAQTRTYTTIIEMTDTSMSADDFEQKYVHNVYDTIAEEFHHSRYALWPCVTQFLDTLPEKSVVLDVGCGNGKYLSYRAGDLVMHGCDTCQTLINISRQRHPPAILTRADCLDLPYPESTFDAVISIAVMHHLSTSDRRSQFMSEIHRVLKPGAPALITTWASTMNDPRKENAWTSASVNSNDYFVPWKNNNNRYYHLFEKHEVLYYAQDVFPSTTQDDIYFEKDNWVLRVAKV